MGSPSAQSMTVCDHRKMSAISPVLKLTLIAMNPAPTVRAGSPIESSSAICSDASRDASRTRPWNI